MGWANTRVKNVVWQLKHTKVLKGFDRVDMVLMVPWLGRKSMQSMGMLHFFKESLSTFLNLFCNSAVNLLP